MGLHTFELLKVRDFGDKKRNITLDMLNNIASVSGGKRPVSWGHVQAMQEDDSAPALGYVSNFKVVNDTLTGVVTLGEFAEYGIKENSLIGWSAAIRKDKIKG